MLIKNLRRVATVAIVAPVLLVSGPAVAMAQDSAQPQRHHASVGDDDGILSDLVTVNLGRDSDRRDDRDRGGILSNLLTVDLGSVGRDGDRRDNRNDREDREDRDGILGDLLGDDDGLFGDDDGLLGLRIL